jgi:hypothetical protein
MQGLLTGAVFGMAFLAFVGAYRSVQYWRGSKRRPHKWVLYTQVGAQVVLGLAALVFGIWFLLFEPSA